MSSSLAGSRLKCDRRNCLSSDAQIVWDALVKKHSQRISSQDTHGKPDKSTYYKTLYQQGFGASLPDTGLLMSHKNNQSMTKWNQSYQTCYASQCSSVDGIICLPNTTEQNTHGKMSCNSVENASPLHYQRMMLETPEKLIDFDRSTPVMMYPKTDRINERSSHSVIESASVGRSTQGRQRVLCDSNIFLPDNEHLHGKRHYTIHHEDNTDTLPWSYNDESASLSGGSQIKQSKPFSHQYVPETPRSVAYSSNDLDTRLPGQDIPLHRDFVDSDSEQQNRNRNCGIAVGTIKTHTYFSDDIEKQQQHSECDTQPLFLTPQPRMNTHETEAGHPEATFSLAYLSQFTNTQCFSPPLDLSPELDLDHSQECRTTENTTMSTRHSDISTMSGSVITNPVSCHALLDDSYQSTSVTAKPVSCHWLNDNAIMMSHRLDRPNYCGDSESGVLTNANVEDGTREQVGLPRFGGAKEGSRQREQQSRQYFKKHSEHPDSYDITLPKETSALSSLRKAAKRKASSETSADVDLRTLEYFLDNAGSGGKKANKCSYNPPVKRNKTKELKSQPETVESSRSVCHQSQLRSVEKLSDTERDALVSSVKVAQEVAVCLVYTDGSSQLREQTDNKNRSNIEDEVAGVAIAYPKSTTTVLGDTDNSSDTVLQFAYIPLDSQHNVYAWSRCVLDNLMAADNTRKLSFDGQELMQTLIKHFDYDHATVTTTWRVLDVKIASWLLDADNPALTFTEVIGHYPELKKQMQECSAGTDTTCGDLKLLGPVTTKLYQQLQNAALWELFEKIEMPLCPLLAVMELRGISIDTSEMIQSGQVLKKKLVELEKEIHKSAGHPFVITSHPQLRQVLFEELKLDQRLPPNKHVIRTLVKQQKSTSEAVLTILQDIHRLPALVLQYRQVQKLKSTYVDSLLGFVRDTQLYTHWDHTAAATGRLTSTDPNIQAIPKVPLQVTPVKETGGDITGAGQKCDGQAALVSVYARAPFISQQGYSLLSADFRQIELRLLAHLSRDPGLLAIFNNPNSGDIFRELTSQWLGKRIEDVSEREREQTKRVVYSVMYGAGKDRLSEYLKISPDEAKCIMNSFLVMFPGVNRFTRKCIEEAKVKGYQETIFRRRRQLPHIHHWKAPLRAQCERQAVNFCVQGSAADLCKAAMLQVEQALVSRPQCRLLVQIHDELLLEVPDTEVDTVAGVVRDIMQSASGLCHNFTQLSVPLKVSIHVGKSWAHMNTWASLGHT